MYTYSFSEKEHEALIDALRKGASRHDSYARFYINRSTSKHEDMAVLMRQLLRRFNRG